MKPLVTDALWERIQPLLPPHPPRRARYPGRKPLDDRMVLTGILFVPGMICPPNSAADAARPADITYDCGTNPAFG